MRPGAFSADAKVQLEASRRTAATTAHGDLPGIAVMGCSHPGGSTGRAFKATCPERDGSDFERASGAAVSIGERRSARCLPPIDRALFPVARVPVFVECLLQPVVGVIGIIDVRALTLDFAVAQALWPLALDVGVAQALGALTVGVGIAEALRPLTVDIEITQTLGPLTVGVGIAQALGALALDVGIPQPIRPLALDVGIPQPIRPLAFDIEIAQRVSLPTVDVGIVQSIGPLALDVEIAQPVRPLALDVRVPQSVGALTLLIEHGIGPDAFVTQPIGALALDRRVIRHGGPLHERRGIDHIELVIRAENDGPRPELARAEVS